MRIVRVLTVTLTQCAAGCPLLSMSLDPVSAFRASHYRLINRARMEHLRSLHLPLPGKSVLELGAGIGDITESLVSMGCGPITRLESRRDNCDVMLREHPEHLVICDDLMAPKDLPGDLFDVSIAYGIFYHLADPTRAISFMAKHTKELAVVETAVSMGDLVTLNRVPEGAYDPTQSVHGDGCRPTRSWMFAELSRRFKHVYCPLTQPDHIQFQLNWSGPPQYAMVRAIFVCSHDPLVNSLLVDHLPGAHTAFTNP